MCPVVGASINPHIELRINPFIHSLKLQVFPYDQAYVTGPEASSFTDVLPVSLNTELQVRVHWFLAFDVQCPCSGFTVYISLTAGRHIQSFNHVGFQPTGIRP